MKDFRGLTICKGDLIAYPGRRGSAMWMNYAEVAGVLPTGEVDVFVDFRRRTKRILRSDRVAVLGRN